MSAFVDVQLIDGLALPYVAGAESALSAADLDPAFATAWQGLLATFPGLILQPLFDAQPVDELADIVDAIRLVGEEPPNPFLWFTVPCDETLVDAIVPALQALPLVALVSQRSAVRPAATVSYGTNPDAIRTLQIQPAPNGIDAIYVWQVAGGTGDGVKVADVESGWNTSHEELLTAHIHSPSGFIADTVPDGGHGTAVAGILVGADNGVGTIGIVPDAQLTLVADKAEGIGDTPEAAAAAAAFSTAATVAAAIKVVGVGGVVLIEEAVNFFARPPKPDGNLDLRPDILIEFEPAVQAAIRLAALFGITVVEPAGNGGVNLDAFPFLAHTLPGAPTFSNAIVVGAGELATPALDFWQRTFSSFGSRVDCFAAGGLIRSPSSAAPDAYQDFSGTSGAGAIVAGAVAAIQGMSQAATGAPLGPTDIRRLFRDPALATTIPPTANGSIGSMPDLRKIARAQGWTRVLPVGAAATGDDALVIAHLDADDHLVRRHWTLFTAWGSPVPLPSPADHFELTAAQSAVTSTAEDVPIDRLVHEAFVLGGDGVHHLFWDSLGQTGDLVTPVAPVSVAAQGRSLAVVRATADTVVVAAISPEGRLVVMTGDPDALAATGLSAPLVIDTVGMYRRVGGPAIASRSAGLADVVVIEDGGGLSWFTGTTLATIGTGWSKGPPEPSATEFDPGAQPALLVTGNLLLAAGVGSEGWLRVSTIDPVVGTIEAPVVVDVQATIATSGPVALGLAGSNVVVLGVDTEGGLRAATRPVAGSDWTSLVAIAATQAISPLGGVAAVSMSDVGVMAIAVGLDGVPQWSVSVDGVSWPALQPVG